MPRPPTVSTTDTARTRPVLLRELGSTTPPLTTLALAAAGGNSAAISGLYHRRFDLVFSVARQSSGRDEHFCLDVVQETFLRVLRSGHSLAKVQDDEHVDRWLASVVRCVTLDMLRSETRRVRRDRKAGAAKAHAAQGNDELERAERINQLERELAALPEQDRELLRLRSAGMTLGAIAELVGSTIGGVHGRLRRLAAELSGKHNEVDHD